jgi:hypothetical protein
MATTTAQIRDLLWPGLAAVFGDYRDLPSQYGDVFETHDSDKAYERDVEVKMLGLAQLRAEGAATAFEDMGERYAYTYRHVGVALGFVMTKFAIRDNLYKSRFGPNTKALKHSLRQTKEVYAAAILNNATDTSAINLGGDGVPLLSANHPIDVGVVGNTPSVQAQLNETSLQDALVAIRRFRDAAGLKVLVNAQKLIVPPELQFTAERLMKTPLRVGTADNDVNAIRSIGFLSGGWKMNDFLSNTASWYIITDCPDGLKHYTRDPLETDMFVDFTTDNLMVKATERYSFGWSNFRAIYGCMP